MESENLTEKSQSGFRSQLGWRLPVILISASLLGSIRFCHRQPAMPVEPEEELPDTAIHIPLPTPLPSWPLFSHPSPQRQWEEIDNPKVYQPTGSGRIASAWYGSVRTRSSGRASFHEGVDIAPVKKDRRGRAEDKIFAVADGEVAYINRVGGNSSYGRYVLLRHQDEVGDVYTLYAHLESIPKNVKVGQEVKVGEVIGQMGHSSTLGIPVQRSHLHFEMCMMLNPSFDKWYRGKKLIPDHGNYHGYNFAGFNPLRMLVPLSGKDHIPFSYLETLQEIKPAWHLVVRSSKRPRYFSMYPRLWEGEPYKGEAFYLTVSESGIPLSGRNATEAEIAALGTSTNKVVWVDEEVLGRNGTRHISTNPQNRTLARNGTRWLEILMYDAR